MDRYGALPDEVVTLFAIASLRVTARALGVEEISTFRDQVLFLKHNLNAQAIGALDAELLAVRTNVDALIADLEAAIAEADQFVASMGTSNQQDVDDKKD